MVNGEGPSTSDADYDASSDPDFYDPFYDDDSEEVLEENRKRIEKLIQEVSRKDGRQMVARLSKRFSSLKLSIENVQYCGKMKYITFVHLIFDVCFPFPSQQKTELSRRPLAVSISS